MGTYGYVDECDTGPKIRIWVILVHKRVLSQIPHHHPTALTDEGQDEHEQRRAGVQPRHRPHERIKCDMYPLQF